MALGGVPAAEIIKIMAMVIRPIMAKAMNGKDLKSHETQLLLLYSLTESQTRSNDQMVMLSRNIEDLTKQLTQVCQGINEIQKDISYLKGRGESKVG